MFADVALFPKLVPKVEVPLSEFVPEVVRNDVGGTCDLDVQDCVFGGPGGDDGVVSVEHIMPPLL